MDFLGESDIFDTLTWKSDPKISKKIQLKDGWLFLSFKFI